MGQLIILVPLPDLNIFKIRDVSQRRFEKILFYYKSWTSLAMPQNRL